MRIKYLANGHCLHRGGWGRSSTALADVIVGAVIPEGDLAGSLSLITMEGRIEEEVMDLEEETDREKA